jgi:DNA replication and repair protein RecF
MVPALAVTELHLSHFRSHRAARLALDGRPVAIFGPNGVGKTNLVEAVSLLSPGRGLRNATSEDLARQPEAIGWKVTAALRGRDGVHGVATWGEGAGRRVEIDGKPAPQAALSAILRVLWLTPAMDRLWTEAAAERRRFLDRAAMSLIPEHAATATGYERAMRERNRLLRDGVGDPAWHDALEAQMARFGAELAANRRAAIARLAAAQDAGGPFPTAELALETEAPAEPEALARALREGRPRDLAAGRSLIGPHRDDFAAIYAPKDIPARLASTGEQKALLVSLILANARAVADAFGAAPILILDEVAAHFDAARRAALYDRVVALGLQAWMTGTEPGLFTELGGHAQRLRVTEIGGLSRVEAC